MASHKRRAEWAPDDSRPSKRPVTSQPVTHRPIEKHKPHPESGIGRNFHSVPYPLTLLPYKSWQALHKDDGSSAVCASCSNPVKPTAHQKKLFLVAERLSWEPELATQAARHHNEEALWAVNAELGIMDPVIFDEEDVSGGKNSRQHEFHPFRDRVDAELAIRLLGKVDGLSEANFRTWRRLTEHLPREVFDDQSCEDIARSNGNREPEPWEVELKTWFAASEEEIEARVIQLWLVLTHYSNERFCLPVERLLDDQNLASRHESIARKIYSLESLLRARRGQPTEPYKGLLHYTPIFQPILKAHPVERCPEILFQLKSLMIQLNHGCQILTHRRDRLSDHKATFSRLQFLHKTSQRFLQHIGGTIGINVKTSQQRLHVRLPPIRGEGHPTSRDHNSESARKPLAELSRNIARPGPDDHAKDHKIQRSSNAKHNHPHADETLEIIDLTAEDDECNNTVQAKQENPMDLASVLNVDRSPSPAVFAKLEDDLVSRVSQYHQRVRSKLLETDARVRACFEGLERGDGNIKDPSAFVREIDRHCMAHCETIDPLVPKPASKHNVEESVAVPMRDAVSYSTVSEFYGLLDKIERTSPIAARFLEAYADHLRSEVCEDCWLDKKIVNSKVDLLNCILEQMPQWSPKIDFNSMDRNRQNRYPKLSNFVLKSFEHLPAHRRAEEWLRRCYQADDEGSMVALNTLRGGFSGAFPLDGMTAGNFLDVVQHVWPTLDQSARLERVTGTISRTEDWVKGIKPREPVADIAYVPADGEGEGGEEGDLDCEAIEMGRREARHRRIEAGEDEDEDGDEDEDEDEEMEFEDEDERQWHMGWPGWSGHGRSHRYPRGGYFTTEDEEDDDSDDSDGSSNYY